MSLLTLSEEASASMQLEPVTGTSLALLQRWMLSLACVNFDLELGPDVEFMYPPLEISKEEKDNIAFSSFPDTSVFSDGNLTFSWRVREVPLAFSAERAPHIPDKPTSHRPSSSLSASSSSRHASSSSARRRSLSARQSMSRRLSWLRGRPNTVPAKSPSDTSTASHAASSSSSSSSPTFPTSSSKSMHSHSRSTSYLYGYTFFLQRRDPSVRRGYFQKSLVILTHLPYVGLFLQLIGRVGPAFFELGLPVLESFVHEVMQWPAPEPGATIQLSALGTLLHASLPHGNEAQNGDGIRDGTDAEHPILASVPPTGLVHVFYELLPDLWRLWECMLTAEPVLIVGHDPRTTSEAVWHLMDLIRPVSLAGDFRPYFHIHDYDFRAFVGRPTPPPGVVLGTTNPFFLQTCSHWPHIVQLGRRHDEMHGRLVSNQTVRVTSTSKRRISKDQALIKQLMVWRSSPDQFAHANVVLRRYFADLTERFLAPLHQHLATLIPASFDLSSPAEAPRIKPFHRETFLQWLKAHPGPLKMRQRSLLSASVLRQSLYADFLESPNFAIWLHERVEAAQEEQRRRRVSALAIGDVVAFGRTRTEIESVDLYLRLRDELQAMDEALARPTLLTTGPSERWRASVPASSDKCVPAAQSRSMKAQRARLAEQMERLLSTLPHDLRVGLP